MQRWLADGKAQGWSRRTLKDREQTMERVCWWLEHEAGGEANLAALNPSSVRCFLAYARESHPEGRYGCDRASARREARPATANAYFRTLRAFSNFCLAEGLVTETPLRNVRAPRVPGDLLPPLSADQVQLLVNAARGSHAPERDVAMIMVLLDTGLRASELCRLTVRDADRAEGVLIALGKGGKKRSVALGVAARRHLWRYLETAERQMAALEEPLFVAEGGHHRGAGLTPWGVHQIIKKAARVAGLADARIGPHSIRRTFAINWLRNGGGLFELMLAMGHSDLTVLRRYLMIAESDVIHAHKVASPADKMGIK